jgi:hypothetical protein
MKRRGWGFPVSEGVKKKVLVRVDTGLWELVKECAVREGKWVFDVVEEALGARVVMGAPVGVVASTEPVAVPGVRKKRRPKKRAEGYVVVQRCETGHQGELVPVVTLESLPTSGELVVDADGFMRQAGDALGDTMRKRGPDAQYGQSFEETPVPVVTLESLHPRFPLGSTAPVMPEQTIPPTEHPPAEPTMPILPVVTVRSFPTAEELVEGAYRDEVAEAVRAFEEAAQPKPFFRDPVKMNVHTAIYGAEATARVLAKELGLQIADEATPEQRREQIENRREVFRNYDKIEQAQAPPRDRSQLLKDFIEAINGGVEEPSVKPVETTPAMRSVEPGPDDPF